MTAKPKKRSAGAPTTREPRRDTVAIATERLRQLIVTGEIPPGTELSQVKLAEMTGVSTTPVREALRRLEAEGLVEARHNHRPRVPAFDPDDLDAVYSTRILLESTAISMTIPTLTAADLDAIAADLDAMRAAGRLEDIDAWEAAHRSFHHGLVAASGPTLARQIQLMMSRSDRYRRMSILGERPYGWTTGEREHQSIFAACQARRPQAASTALATHLARSAYSVLTHLDPDRHPIAIPAALRTIGAEPPRPDPAAPHPS
jgi:DNA-binding GntR family transcriptional regulator